MGDTKVWEGERIRANKRWNVTAVLLCLCFVLGSILFLTNMGRQYTKENLVLLDNAAFQHETALVKQVEGDFQTLHGVAVFAGRQDILDPEQLIRLVGEVNEGNAFIRMGLASLTGELELMELGGKRYPGVDISEEEFFRQALAGRDMISEPVPDPYRDGEYINYYAVPVRNGEEAIVGVLCAVNGADVVRAIIEAPLLNDSGYTNLYSSRGKLILSSGTALANGGQPQELAGLAGLSEKERAAVEEALEQNSSVHFNYKAGNTGMLAVLEPSGVEDWFVLCSIPVAALNQRYVVTSAGAMLIIVAACSLFTLLLWRQRRMMNRNQAVVERLAYEDSLTGGRNYNQFLMEAELVRRQDGWMAVWYCDLKKFKYYNDALGYAAGDDMLRRMYRLFERLEQPDGLFCRLMADNFVGLRWYAEREELTEWFSRVVREFHQEESETASRSYIELCMGFYCPDPSDSGLTVNEMVNRANMAQKSIKGESGSRCAFFNETLRQRFQQEAAMEAQGQQALAEGQFQPYFQPKFDIQHGDRLAGAEVLCRWIHPQKGMIPPDQFIPVFEKSGLIMQLDRYMFEQACSWYRRYLDGGGARINLAVNVSRAGLLREDFVDYYVRVKETYGIPDGAMELEVTESLALGGEELLCQLVRELQAHGFTCSLDDFGSGYSSLNLLKNLPIRVLKLDILFFQRSVDKVRERIVVRNIVNMARELKIRVIAEGVEETESVEFLRGAGCDIVQGYVFAKPMPLAEFEALLAGSAGK